MKLNRTLILPPFRTYKFQRNVPFDEWFDVDAISKAHRVILAQEFMDSVAPMVWPPDQRTGFCYQVPGQEPCVLKEGNPFEPFWSDQGIDFPRIERHDLTFRDVEEWTQRYTGDAFPVIAMKGAPAAFPMFDEDVHLQQHLVFSAKLEHEADDLIRRYFGNEPYVGIHLRNGPDWVSVCDLVDSSRSSLMASYQCTGFDDALPLTKEMCLPSKDTVIKHTKRVVEQSGMKHVMIATDKYSMVRDLTTALPGVKVIHVDPDLPVLDVVLLVKSKVFIGNCVSSFSAFVWRHRLHHRLGPTEHFGKE